MSIKVQQTAAEWAAREYQEALETAGREESYVELRKVNFRLPSESVSLLDYLAQKLQKSRSAVGENLLCRAIEEAVVAVGLPGEEDGFELHLNEEAFNAMQAEKVAA